MCISLLLILFYISFSHTQVFFPSRPLQSHHIFYAGSRLVSVMFPIDKDDRSNFNTGNDHIIFIFVLCLHSYFISLSHCHFNVIFFHRSENSSSYCCCWYLRNFCWIFLCFPDLFFFYLIWSYSVPSSSLVLQTTRPQLCMSCEKKHEICICFYLVIKMFWISKSIEIQMKDSKPNKSTNPNWPNSYACILSICI